KRRKTIFCRGRVDTIPSSCDSAPPFSRRRIKTARSASDILARQGLLCEEATMRTIVLVLLALVGMSLTSTDADAGAGCANRRRGVSNCGYSSFEQCWATVRGMGGSWVRSAFPGAGDGMGAGGGGPHNTPRA